MKSSVDCLLKMPETIANAHAELLAAEWLKDLYKQLGLAIPVELQTYKAPKAPEYPPPLPPLCFCPDRTKRGKQPKRSYNSRQPKKKTSSQMSNCREDWLATSYLGNPSVLRMIGLGDEEHIITKVLPGTAPLQDYEEDDPSQVIILDYETDDSDDVDDLSEVSMTSTGGITKEEFQGLLGDVAALHQKMAASINALAACVEDMSTEQVEEAAVAVTSELGHMRGLSEITGAFDKAKIGLILATGVCKYHEYQCLKGNWEEKDIIPYRHLEKKFGANKRTLMECSQGYKYRYLKGVPTKVSFTLTKLEEEEEAQSTTTATVTASNNDPSNSSSHNHSRDHPYHHNISSNRASTNISVLSGPPTPPKVEIYLEKLAVNAVVKLSKGNINAPLSNK